MRFLTTLASLACVSFAAGAVAKTYTPQNADKYAEERGFQGLEDPADQAAAEIQARDAEPDALADAARGWFAGAHGGKAAAPAYKGFAHKHGHFVREAMPMPEVDGSVGDVPEFDDDVDMSLEGYEEAHQDLVARSAMPELEGLEGVDTSLEGYEVEGGEDDDDDDDEDEDDEPSLHARDVQEGEEGEDDEEPAYVDDDDDDDLQGPDHELVARSLEGEGVDTSLEGYGDLDEASADNNGDDDDDDEDDENPSFHARSVPFRKQGWTKPNMASAVKSAWGSYATKGGARKVSSHHPGHQHLPHHAREADPEPEAEADPEAKGRGKGHHAGHNHAVHTSRPGKPSGAQTSWAHKPSGTKKAGKGGWGFPW
ncbi:hypothetical protein KC332_g7517 [Hortaea werneckii]|nr:hypothetical protein KC350_g13922 [Hortaea werneckii]KAI6828699.1 hypothetical protein KC358_g7181 [Hortaea werneckii]KAI6930118.1 hypothetical protein KC348_g7656 [Hortaea werneckii]KAI6935226.1 hypothetical protein KC341_g7065 [Hortaea werneckii]KAI6964164.1 hypothetical protein KC321_g10819 [Hortaea werneckii]